jgi:selenium metabolism protein YedF
MPTRAIDRGYLTHRALRAYIWTIAPGIRRCARTQGDAMSSTAKLDCRGLACPGPVLRTIEILTKENPQSLEILVDDPAAKENVSRLLGGKGYAVTAVEAPGLITIRAELGAAAAPSGQAPADACATAVSRALGGDKTVAFITAEHMGRGDDELGGKLMLNFLATLPELGGALWRVVLVNGGVRLACEGHPCLEKIEALAASGVSVLVCGTCLGFFGLMEQKRVGETTNMLDVVTSLHLAGKVIQI